MKVEGPKTMIHEFYSLQEERVRVYHLLDEGHTAYLGTSSDYDFVAYRQIVHDRTEDFKRISQRIIGIETAFREQYQNVAIADCLKKVQEAEQDKLEKTAALQLTKQRLQDAPGNEEHKRELSDLKHRLAGVMERITDAMEDLKYETDGL
ncbi:required for excision 1-B domain-containing protein-like isoform X1 [Lytechinus pictus]|uniref:required for excision 1-B domain-containing protein-like isoform X1 n=2 Tax=Lytechinus pictus TaxID=7653 RepID=UPI0030B9E048